MASGKAPRKKTPRLLPRGIRGRLYLLIALVLLPMLLLLGWMYVGAYQNRRALAIQTELEVAQGIASTFEAKVDDIRRQSLAVGEAILTLSPFTEAKARRILTFNANQNRAVRYLSWASPGGRILVSNEPSLVGRDLAEESYFQQILSGSGWAIGNLTRLEEKPDPGFAIVSAVRNGAGLQGVVVAVINPDQLDETVFQQRPAEGAYTLFDRHGVLVYRSLTNRSLINGFSWEDRLLWRETDPILTKALTEGEPQAGEVVLEVPGGRWLVARVPVRGIGWVAGSARPAEIVLAPLRQRLLFDGALALLIASGAFLLAWHLARTISGPILRLERDARKMGVGRVARFEDFEASLEVRQLRETVTGMATELLGRAAALRESEERFRDLADNMSQFAWMADEKGWIFWYNRRWYEYSGTTPEQMRGWGWCKIAHPDHVERVVEKITHCFSTGEFWEDIFPLRGRDGQYRWFLSRAVPIRDIAGRVVRWFGTNTDVTEERKAEQALRDSEEKFRAIFEQAGVGIGRVNFTDARWVDVNDAFCSMLGYSAEEMRITPWPQITHPDDVDLDLLSFRQMAAGELDNYTVEKRFIHRQGHLVWARLTLSLVRDVEGRPDYEIAVIEDISERKRAEEDLRRLNAELEQRVQERTEALTAVNRELEAFTYTVSHDLRAPLRHITSFVELLNDRYGKTLDETGNRYIRIIGDAGRRMATLIDDLLTFSRIGRAALNKRKVSLKTMIREVRKELTYEAEGRKIEWRIEELPQVQADPVLLRNVITNLLANALKYSRHRNPARIEIGCREEEDETVCFVKDNGAGFDMRFADKLFGVFQRLHPQEKFEGTGIGLASVRRIIQRHGGRTWAEGEVDKGATFYFTLPREGKES